jgi:tetratricopeptide (TPR) repeat protein
MYQKALEIDERIGDEPGIATDYGNLASVCVRKGEVARALEYYEKALKITERTSDRHGVACIYFNLGSLYVDLGNRVQARVHYEKAKALYEMVGDVRMAQDAARALQSL